MRAYFSGRLGCPLFEQPLRQLNHIVGLTKLNCAMMAPAFALVPANDALSFRSQ